MGFTSSNTRLALYQRRYYIKGWYGDYHLSAEELKSQIEKDAKNGPFNWIASAPVLWDVISRHDFPYGVRDEIAALIVDCFAELEDPHYNSYRDPSELEAVSNCYYVLPLDHPSRQNYLTAIIKREIRLSYSDEIDSDIDVLLLFSGEAHSFFEADYIEKKLMELREQERSGKKLNFAKLHRKIRKDYSKLYHKAAKSGLFERDTLEQHEFLVHSAVRPAMDEFRSDGNDDDW